ncbi:hypothetical protein [Caldalkalibacillus salinus]|uniref:hypothetical protein n=1 Tax=Caldalkalibacillus salinus TaxID=2803787 RepID=UPI0019226298|nr:hypothetical protein [Caldalkalibacillus salinus]
MQNIGLRARKLLLTLHILFASIMFGVTVVFLILSIAAAASSDRDILMAAYTSMHLLAKTSVRASTIGTVITGVLLSVVTHWGFFRYHWLILKEGLTVLSIGLGMVGIYVWSLNGLTIVESQGIGALENPEFLVNRTYLFIGIGLQLVSLIAIFLLSVLKPWGKRKKRQDKVTQ